MPSDLNRMEVNICEHGIALNRDPLKIENEELEWVTFQNFIFQSNQQGNCEIKDEVFVSLEEKDLPHFIQQA